jgi:hypothetical protein
MVRAEVPARVYARAVDEMQANHRPMWAVMELTPGRAWRVHALPWEVEDAWKAEGILKAIRDALRAHRRPKAR